MKGIAIALVSSVIAFFFLKLRKQNKMKLSENFTLGEFLSTSTGLFNEPGQESIQNLRLLVNNILQPFRDKVGRLDVTSGYRSKAVNEAVGGVEDSAHTKGLAGDVVPVDMEIEEAFKILKSMKGLPIRKAILENRKGVKWIHISLDKDAVLYTTAPKREFLTANYNPQKGKMEYAFYA